MSLDESKLGDTRIFIINALRIIGITGGSITCTPGEHRMWKVRNEDVSVNSVNLSRACAIFVEDVQNPERLS